MAEKQGFEPTFMDVRILKENNVEVLLSKYFDQQMIRNEMVGQDPKFKMCSCSSCCTYLAHQQPTDPSPPL
jgi:hypothetical protein